MSVLTQFKNNFHRLFKRGDAILWEFDAEPSNELRNLYRSKTADIFFSIKVPRRILKWAHYLPIYDQLLCQYNNTNVKMLEIGVYMGGSLLLWRKLLGDKATIFGIDINPACAAYNDEYASVRIGSQADPEFLRVVVEEMGGIDIVLDDGSHIASDQRVSFEVLFPLLNEGGLYIIEDMHTAYWPNYRGGLRERGTAIEFLKDKIDDMHRHYRVAGTNKAELIPEIESIQFFDSIAAIKKKRQLPRRSVRVPARRGIFRVLFLIRRALRQ